MRHQTAVELDEKIVGQPIGAIGGLRDLQPRASGRAGGELGGGDAVAPAGEIAAQDAQPVEIAAAARHLAARPPRPHHRPVAAIAGEELVAALAGEDDLEPALAGRTGELVGRQDCVVGSRIVDRRNDLG